MSGGKGFLAVIGTVLALHLVGPSCSRRSQETGNGWNVVFILVDTLRADHLRCYGYDRDTSPVIDAFASEGVLFENAYSQASWTIASVSSILTSYYPFTHGLTHARTRKPLPEVIETLPELLSTAGYRTAAFVANGIVMPETGMDQGFDVFENIPRKYEQRDEAALVNQEALSWLRGNADHRFFLYLHYMDPHDPYDDPEGLYRTFDPDYEGECNGRIHAVFEAMRDGKDWEVPPRDLRHLLARYDGEIRYVDSRIGEVLAELDRLGLEKKTVVVLTSDHGEQFLDHGSLMHATSLHQEEIHVPLALRYPRMPQRGTRIRAPVESIDVFPTILDLLSLPVPKGLDGTSLLPLLRGREAGGEVFSETAHGWIWEDGRVKNKWSQHLAIIRDGMKLIHREDGEDLYRLATDPGEAENLVETDAALASDLRTRLLEWEKRTKEREFQGRVMTEEERRILIQRLRQMNYLEEGDDDDDDDDAVEPPSKSED